MSTKGGAGGNRKSSKKDQPKRQRYNSSGRAAKHAIKNLERHLRKYAAGGQDKQALSVLSRLKGVR